MRTENKTSKLLQAPKNTSEQDAISLSFVSGREDGASSLDQSLSKMKQSHHNPGFR